MSEEIAPHVVLALRDMELLDVVSDLIPWLVCLLLEFEDYEVHKKLDGALLAVDWVLQGLAEAMHLVLGSIAYLEKYLVL